MIPELSVGIDYHKDSLQVCILESCGKVKSNRRIRNDIEELIELIGAASQKVVVTAEACNGSSSFLDALHSRTNWEVKLCHPGYAQRMRSNPDKTDKSDGELIADLTRVGYLPEVWLAPPHLRDLRALVRYRALQMKEARAMKLRIRSLLRNNRISLPEGLSLWSKSGYRWLSSGAGLSEHSQWVMSRYLLDLKRLQQEVIAATRRIAQFVKTDALAQKLLKYRGIGIITAAVMRAEIGTFTRFKTGKQLARFCGLSPCNRSSGSVMADSGLIRSGNTLLKSCIAQGVWTLIRFDEHWKQFANRLLGQGKPKGVVASAVANRWIRKLFHELKAY
jgi:transposase